MIRKLEWKLNFESTLTIGQVPLLMQQKVYDLYLLPLQYWRSLASINKFRSVPDGHVG